MNEPLLEVRDLVVEYDHPDRGRFRAVDRLSFTLGPGATLGIVGESGCGKSSLARAILQLESFSGSVRLQGQELGELRGAKLRSARRDMQAVFQDPLASLSPRMSVAQVLEEPLQLHRRDLGRTERRGKVLAMLERVGLERDHAARYPHELSGGQCQRVAIARAVICEPRLLVCDEPVSALDTSVRGQVLGLLESLKRELGISMLFIAHDMTAVRYLCDEVLVMYAGRTMEIASREVIFANAVHPYTRSLLQAVLPPDPNLQPPRDTSPANRPGDGQANACRYLARCEYAEPECATGEPALREHGPGHVACRRAGEF